MSYYVLVRGPLGVGKTTVSKRLALELGADHLSIDRILDDNGLWESGRLSEFLRANELAARRAEKVLASATPVILDGNFYWKTQIVDLRRHLHYPGVVFTLNAPLSECIARDARRTPSHGAEAVRQVYAKATAFEVGVPIDAYRPVATIVKEILSRLPLRYARVTCQRG